jgi:hypothetical protein
LYRNQPIADLLQNDLHTFATERKWLLSLRSDVDTMCASGGKIKRSDGLRAGAPHAGAHPLDDQVALGLSSER